ncbi:hypothetical protein MNBD_ALPHA07-967 [hydrothermal vent metagenome]|uniref:Methyltransferase domain-containing protein n=1 Tax=hydrothermal vent metagenome TaxID=652676 RepID=A0A3B0SQ40_9ZZZZ
MSVDDETLKTYGEMAGDYVKLVESAREDPQLTAFVGALRQGARVLDLGCGPGHAAALMAKAGMRVDATDACPEMVALAAGQEGVNVRIATFDEIAGRNIYDGIWANFSLLHAPRSEMPRHLTALRQALKPGGLFHIALKAGAGEKRDTLGRLYTYYSEAELSGLLKDAGFVPFSCVHGDGRGMDGKKADWIAIAAHG